MRDHLPTYWQVFASRIRRQFRRNAAMPNNSQKSKHEQLAEEVVQQKLQEPLLRPKDQALLNLLTSDTSGARPGGLMSAQPSGSRSGERTQLLIEDLMARGLSEEEARREIELYG